MNVIIIDPHAKTITEVEHTGGLDSIYHLTKCSCITAVNIDFVNTMYLDDEGLINDSPKAFFTLEGHPQPYVNHGMVIGTNDEGDDIATTLTLEEVKRMVTFVTREQAFSLARANGV